MLAAALVAAAGGAALAHVTNVARVAAYVGDRAVDLETAASAHDLAVALGIETDMTAPVPQAAFEERSAALDDYFRTRIAVWANGERCTAEPATTDYGDLPNEVFVALHFVCPQPVERLAIGYGLFFDIDGTHRALGKVVVGDTEESFLFDRSLRTFETNVAAPQAQLSWNERFGRLFLLGVEHILLGIDHVLFLLALLLVSGNIWHLVKVVTAFTIAHSVTLGLAWFDVVDLPVRLVESLIALSIAYVALENLLRRNTGHRWMLAGGFGLVHGLGFYRVLSDLRLGQGDAVTTLLAFNLGVEAGQLVIVAVIYLPLVWWLRQSWYARSAQAASLAILLLASWWTVQRAFLA